MAAFRAPERPQGPIRKLDLTGKERQLRLAVEVMGRVATEFARSARRSLPFLSRYKSQLVPGAVQSFQSSNEGDLASPTFTMAIGTADGMGWGSVTLDANAVAMVLEGALGGSGPFWETPLEPALTAAQRALLTRVTRSLASELADQIRRKVGLEMNVLDAASGAPVAPPDAGDLLRVSCAIEVFPFRRRLSLRRAHRRSSTQPKNVTSRSPRKATRESSRPCSRCPSKYALSSGASLWGFAACSRFPQGTSFIFEPLPTIRFR
jgi:hypothetical protein